MLTARIVWVYLIDYPLAHIKCSFIHIACYNISGALHCNIFFFLSLSLSLSLSFSFLLQFVGDCCA